MFKRLCYCLEAENLSDLPSRYHFIGLNFILAQNFKRKNIKSWIVSIIMFFCLYDFPPILLLFSILCVLHSFFFFPSHPSSFETLSLEDELKAAASKGRSFAVFLSPPAFFFSTSGHFTLFYSVAVCELASLLLCIIFSLFV